MKKKLSHEDEESWAEGYTHALNGVDRLSTDNLYLIGYKEAEEFGRSAGILPPFDQSLPNAK